ncbi:hypothetical protein ACSSS7_003460 [Eimeria intestinalis]
MMKNPLCVRLLASLTQAQRRDPPAFGWGAPALALVMRGAAGEGRGGGPLPGGPHDEGGREECPLDEGGPFPAALSTALHAVAHAAPWAEAQSGWAPPPAPTEVEKYAEALSLLAAACRSSACARDAVLEREELPQGAPKREGPPRGYPLLLHFCRVLCSLCCACLAEVGVDYGGPPGILADASAGASPGGPAVGGLPEGPSSDVWVHYGVSLLAIMKGGEDSCAAAILRQLVALLYPLTSCLCVSRAAARAAEVLETPEGAHCFCFLAALAAAAAEEEVKVLTAVGAAAATPREDCTSAAAEAGPSSATPSNSSNSSSSNSGCPLLLELLGAYEGPLSLPGVAAAARGGPLRGLHKAAQRGAARLLGRAASLRDSAAAVSAWLVYHRLSSSSSSGSSNSSGTSSSGDSSFSASNVRHLLALLIASVRNHLSRPLEQRVSALCLREALKEQRMQAALAGPTHDAALAFAAVCLQALQALAAAAETAAQEVQMQAHTPNTPPAAAAAAAPSAAAAAAAARMHHLRAAAPISEMLALLCASSPALRASVAARLDTLPPPVQPMNGSSGSNSSSSSSNSSSSISGTPMDSRQQQQQQQQQQASQISPGRGRSSAALSSSSLPALLYVAAWGDHLGCTYSSAFVELCVRSHGTRDVGRHLTPQQRKEAVAALAANAGLLQWEEAAQRGDTAELLRVLHVSLDLAACSKRHLPRSLRMLQRAAAALAEGPLCNAHAAAEAEEALLVVHNLCRGHGAPSSRLSASFCGAKTPQQRQQQQQQVQHQLQQVME